MWKKKPVVQADQRTNYIPIGLFTILEPRDQEIGEFYVVQERCTTYLDTPKLWKGRLGCKLKNTVKANVGEGE